ncbi:MAG: hypothetical protein FD179_1785 [Erysipelotrichaceae bacterium]|nr:MAG: hypothetical protein FD179_1785 [Erysipelotrichaceae bacterium]
MKNGIIKGLVILCVASILFMAIRKEILFNVISIPSVGSITVSSNWHVTKSESGLIFSNKSLDQEDVIIYMFQVTYEKRLDEWYVINNEVGIYISKGIYREGKGSIYSNSSSITSQLLLKDGTTSYFYELKVLNSHEQSATFMVNPNYVKWNVIEKIAQSFVE